MKITKSTIISFLLLASTFTVVKAQKKVAEGVVTYSVFYELTAQQLLYANELPKEITCYFRGDSTAAIVKQGDAIIKGVSVFKANYHSLLVDIPSVSKKIAVVLTPVEIEQEKSANPQLKGTVGTEKQNINGFNCVQVMVTNTKTGDNYEIWVTNDIEMAPNSVSRLVSDFGGVPVRFVTFNNGIKLTAEIEEIKEVTLPAGFFSATKEYVPMSFTELQAMK